MAMQTEIPEFSKLDNLGSLTTMHTKPFKKSTIPSVFEMICLIPHNPEMVLQKICLKNDRSTPSRPVTPPPHANLFTTICKKNISTMRVNYLSGFYSTQYNSKRETTSLSKISTMPGGIYLWFSY